MGISEETAFFMAFALGPLLIMCFAAFLPMMYSEFLKNVNNENDSSDHDSLNHNSSSSEDKS